MNPNVPMSHSGSFRRMGNGRMLATALEWSILVAATAGCLGVLAVYLLFSSGLILELM